MTHSAQLKTVQFKCSYYTAGVVIDADGIVIQAAPIIKWMIGKHWSYLANRSGMLSQFVD